MTRVPVLQPWSACRQVCSPTGAGGESVSFSSFWRPHTLLAREPSFPSRGSRVPSLCFASPHHVAPAACSGRLPPALLKTLVITSPPSPTIQENLPISGQLISNLDSICNLRCPLPCKVTWSQTLGSTAGTSLGVHRSAYPSRTEPTGSVIFG